MSEAITLHVNVKIKLQLIGYGAGQRFSGKGLAKLAANWQKRA